MKKFTFFVLFLSFLALSCVQNDKKSVQFTDGTMKTVYSLIVDKGTVSYYISQEDASKENNKVTVPLGVIKQIVDLKDE